MELRLSTEATNPDPDDGLESDEGLALDDGLDPQWAALAEVRAVVGSDPDRAFWNDRRSVTGLFRSLLPGGSPSSADANDPGPDELAATGADNPPRPREGRRSRPGDAPAAPSTAAGNPPRPQEGQRPPVPGAGFPPRPQEGRRSAAPAAPSTAAGFPSRPREGARPPSDISDPWPSSATSPSDGVEVAAAGSPPVLDLLDAPPAGRRRYAILGSRTTARRVQQGSIAAAGLAMLALTAVLIVPDEGRVEATDSTTSTAPVSADTPATAPPTTADPLLVRNTLDQDSSSSSSAMAGGIAPAAEPDDPTTTDASTSSDAPSSSSGPTTESTAGPTTGPGDRTTTTGSTTTSRPTTASTTGTSRATTTTSRRTTTSRATTTAPTTSTTRRTTTTAPTTTAPTTTAPTTTTTDPTTTSSTTAPTTTTTAPTTTTTAPTTTTTAPTTSSTGCSGPTWKLVLDEQFSGSSVNTGRWQVYNSGGNANHGVRRPSAMSVSGGILTITASMQNGTLVSGGMEHRHDQTYGRYEFRVRTDQDPSEAMSGVVMTWPQSDVHPRDGENNIYETLATPGDRHEFYSFIHKPFGTVHEQDYTVHPVDASSWHTMAMEWTPDWIKLYRDGVLVKTIDETSANLVPDVAHHATIQLDAWKDSLPADVTMQVDYIKVYSMQGC